MKTISIRKNRIILYDPYITNSDKHAFVTKDITMIGGFVEDKNANEQVVSMNKNYVFHVYKVGGEPIENRPIIPPVVVTPPPSTITPVQKTINCSVKSITMDAGMVSTIEVTYTGDLYILGRTKSGNFNTFSWTRTLVEEGRVEYRITGIKAGSDSFVIYDEFNGVDAIVIPVSINSTVVETPKTMFCNYKAINLEVGKSTRIITTFTGDVKVKCKTKSGNTNICTYELYSDTEGETQYRIRAVKAGTESIIIYDANDSGLNITISLTVKEPAADSTPSTPSTGSTLLYSFGLLSDIHLDGVDNEGKSKEDFTKALSLFNDKASFICISGDVSRDGRAKDWTLVKTMFAKSKVPIYCIKGNHDNKSVGSTEFKNATGRPDDYVIEYKGDVYIYLSMKNDNGDTGGLDSSKLTWLKKQLTTYKNKRTFLIHHYYIPGTTNPNNKHNNGMNKNNSTVKQYMSIVQAEKDLIYISGHSHLLFECESKDSKANYYHKENGPHYIHVPSGCSPRDYNMDKQFNKGEGYLVDVYSDKIIFKAYDIVGQKYLTKYVYTIKVSQ